ncbi:MAG: PAS domain S-box protein [Candidatus Thermoplasmatota archaeon]|nr:PAS domain S-box protein [Candidatus Thermoplasmatota archaeon]MBS3789497.1 PAS domain S-box protein [Candidatus Thermoplasmatota archaeon]
MRFQEIDILLVDDEPGFLEQAKGILEEIDDRFVIETSSTVENALEQIENKNFDAVVSDYLMTDKNGIEFLRILREEKENMIPFILFTGRGWEEVAMKALNIGANKYIWKNEEVSLYEKEKKEPVDQYEVLAKEIVKEVKNYENKKVLELTRRTIEKSKEGIFWVDPKGEILYVNEAVRDMLGYKQKELIGKNISEIDPAFLQEDREEAWKKLKEEGSRTFKSKHETKDGTVIPVEITSNYVRDEDKELEFAFVRRIDE